VWFDVLRGCGRGRGGDTQGINCHGLSGLAMTKPRILSAVCRFRRYYRAAPLGGSWSSRESVLFAGWLVMVGRMPFLMSVAVCDV
jgi:hypothetical protein